jgi:hypothetical protein
MPPTNRRPHLVECGPGNNTSVLAGIDNSGYSTKTALNQAENTVVDAARRFRRAQARRLPLLTVRIGVHATSQPHGRSRPFSLSHDDLDRLLETAAQLEDGDSHG